MPVVKRLMILRHAKSDWDALVRRDHERPLNKRGARAARTMGKLVSKTDQVPDHIISSTATRARTTAEIAGEAGEWGATLELTDALYGTSADGAMRVAAGCDPDVDRLMLVGHQPAWGSLVSALTGAPVQVRTATLVAIDLSISGWGHVETARGEIAYVLQPRLFEGDRWAELA